MFSGLTLRFDHPISTTPNRFPSTIGFNPTTHGDANAVRILPDAIGIYGWSDITYEGHPIKESVVSTSYGLIAYESQEENSGRIVYFAFNVNSINEFDIQQKLIQNSENWLRRT